MEDVKKATLEPIFDNKMMLEFALKQCDLSAGDLHAATNMMQKAHDLQIVECYRIGCEKPGDLCQQLKENGWIQKFEANGDLHMVAVMKGCMKIAELARLQADCLIAKVDGPG